MKTKKIVIGAMAAAMLSLSVCSLAPVIAAGETVQISVSEATANAGEQFTVEVSFADIPSAGIQAANFSLEYDSSLLTISSIEAGKLTETGASSADSTASLLPNFNSYSEEGIVFCTITGTVAASAAPGTKADIKVVATKRNVTSDSSSAANTSIDCGYMKDGSAVKYNVETVDGAVIVPDKETTTTTTTTATNPTQGGVVYGDANCDGDVRVGDAVLILQALANKDKYGVGGSDAQAITAQGWKNADCYNVGDGVSPNDALAIQKLDAKIIESLPEMP